LFLVVVFDFNSLNFILGGIIVLFGLLIRFLSMGFAGDWMRGSEVRADYVLDEGLYSVMRHPLYLGNFFIGFGFTLFSGFYPFYLLPFYSLIFSMYYYLIIKEEENFLENKFGDTFVRYRKNTPAFLPNFKRWKRGRFLGKFALRMERSTYLTVFFIYLSFLIRVFLFD